MKRMADINWREYLDAFLKRGAYDPTGRDQEIAKLRGLLDEIGTEVLGLTSEQVAKDPRLVRDYAAKAVGSRTMALETIRRRTEMLREALGADESLTYPQLVRLVLDEKAKNGPAA